MARLGLVLLPLLLLPGCKESGPTAAELKAAREKLCAEAAPGLRAKGEQVRRIEALAKSVAQSTADAPATRPVKLRELHVGEADATADVAWLGDAKPSRLGTCLARLESCEGDWLESTFSGCASIDAYVLVRPVVHEKAAVNEAMLNKFNPGHVQGDALAFSLAADGGMPERLGAAVYDTKLRGGVDVERDATTEERTQALNDALRKQVLSEVEARLRR